MENRNAEIITALKGLKQAYEKLSLYFMGIKRLSKLEHYYIKTKCSLPEIEHALELIAKLDKEEKQSYILGGNNGKL